MKHILYVISIFLVLTVLASCTDKEAMRQRLDYVSQCNRADTVFTEAWLPTVDSLVRYFDRHGNANEKMMAHYLKGRVHHDMGESPIALECYQQAAEMADTTEKDCDLHTLAAIYGQMADLFHRQFLPSDEMKAQKMTEYYFWKNGDTLAAIKSYELRIRPLFLKNETDSMILIMQEARKRYLQIGNREKAAQAIYSLVNILLDRNQIKEAKKYLDIYEKESGNFDVNGNLIYGSIYYYDKGRYLLAIGQIDSARLYFNKALEQGLFEAGYKGLLSFYKAKHIPDSIAKYAELFANANDSSYLHVNQEKVHQVSAMYDYSRNREEMLRKEKEASDLKSYIYIILLLVIVIFSFSTYLFYRYRTRQVTLLNHLISRKIALEKVLREKEQEISSAIDDTESNYKKVIQEKQASIDSAKKELESLRGEITSLQRKTERIQAERMEDDFYSLDFVNAFENKYKEYANDYKVPTTREWLRLEKIFSIHFPTYYEKITSKQEMTKEHIRICMLIRLDFKERMMAVALKTDGKRIDRAKRQANRILFQEDNASSFRKHLSQFF